MNTKLHADATGYTGAAANACSPHALVLTGVPVWPQGGCARCRG